MISSDYPVFTTAPTSVKKHRKVVLPFLQRIGKSLLFPIAMLPFAAIFWRIGACIPTGVTRFADVVQMIFGSIGSAVFDNLPMLFAIGAAFGFAKDSRGEAAIVGFLVMILLRVFLSAQIKDSDHKIYFIDLMYGGINFGKSDITRQFAYGFGELFGSKYSSIMINNVLNGIIVGLVVSTVYNFFNGIELPSILGFFSGRRLIPVLGLIFGMCFILLWAIIFPWLAWCIYKLSTVMGQAIGNRWANAGIMFGYDVINRLLIPFGLHHIPNTLFWFTLQDFANQQGDINIFLKAPASIYDGEPILGTTDVYHSTGYNNAGTFQSGFFPTMMFGLPALCFAFYYNARGDIQKQRVASLLFGSAVVSFFTGITEPIEFSFLFISPIFFVVHAFLTGFWGFIVGLFGIQLGFGFSAGLIDYLLSLPKSFDIINTKLHGIYNSRHDLVMSPAFNKTQAVMANPLWILPIGVICSLSYFFIATFLIKRFHVAAPGIPPNELLGDSPTEFTKVNESIATVSGSQSNKYTNDATQIIEALGVNNIVNLECCATRLRLTVRDVNKIDETKLKSTKIVRGTIKVGDSGYQIVIGPTVEMVMNEINRLLDLST